MDDASARPEPILGAVTTDGGEVDPEQLRPVTTLLAEAAARLQVADPRDTPAVLAAAWTALGLAASVGRFLAETGTLDHGTARRNAAPAIGAAEIQLRMAPSLPTDMAPATLAVVASPSGRLPAEEALALHAGVLGIGSACNIVGAAARSYAADRLDHAACDLVTAAGYEVWMSYDGDHPELWGAPPGQYGLGIGMHPATVAYLDAQDD